MNKKTNKEEKLELSEDQERVAEALVFSGVSFERDRLTKLFSPHRGKAIQVDAVIDIINQITPKESYDVASEEDSSGDTE